MTVTETLKAARAKIALREHWAQGIFASDINGRRVHVMSPTAVCFCASGAISNVSNLDDRLLARIACENVVSTGLIDYNDTHTHAEVLAMFDRAIAASEAAHA